jgi:ligand-binding sensor domain-containing protein
MQLKVQSPPLSLLLVVLFFTSCNGQTNTVQPNDAPVEQLTYTSKNTRLIKSQGTNEHQNIHCSLEDKHGHLWFGTSGEGVYRYDGKEFYQYTVKDGLSHNKIWCILEDTAGNIWFGTDDGISRYNGKTISKVPFTLSSSTGIFPTPVQPGQNEVWSMLQDKSGTIWFGTSHDLYCYNGKSFSRLLDNPHIINQQQLHLTWIQSMLEASDGSIWFGSGPIDGEGVIRFDGKSITSSKPNGDTWIRKIIQDKSGILWFSGRHNGVSRYDGHAYTAFTDKGDIGAALFMDQAGNIWFDGGEKVNTIESINGLWRYDGHTFENFTTKDGMGKKSVWNMLEDSHGNIWIGMRNCELYRYDGQTFEAFSQ